VRQALASLVEEGLIERRQGAGSFVTQRTPLKGATPLTGFIEDLIAMGVETSVRVLDVDIVQSTEQEAAKLGLASGSPIVQIKRLRYYRNIPFSYVLIYLPESIGRKLSIEDFTKGSLLKMLEEKQHIQLGEAFQVISAALADGYVAGLLETNVGAPLLSIDRTVYSEAGNPIQYVKTYYRSDMYYYTVRLARARKGRERGWIHQ
jgi:GntR family transcriptional regulator